MRILAAMLGGVLALAACAHAVHSTLPDGGASTSASAQRASTAYQSYYDFRNNPDGAYPHAALLPFDGYLYGTTTGGGSNSYGTVFNANGNSESVLYSFKGGDDGAHPDAPLILHKGNLYGTTVDGGRYSAGTIFELREGGSRERVIYAFTGGADGANPYSPLLGLKGELYGTTYAGGLYGSGTVFALDSGGRERTLHHFGASSGDGANPYAGVIAPTGALYGTTYFGGAHGQGTVYTVTTSGKERVLHSFGATPSDGTNPRGGLTLLNGMLFGTTYYGGKFGGGSVFKMSLAGDLTVIHSFKGEPDGADPLDVLLPLDGALYGTTYGGGINGCGTVFEITPSGKERVLYAFQGHAHGDGAGPWGGVVKSGQLLYGTASLGGDGVGTIFRISP